MPRVREIKSLKGICLDYVAKAVNEWINKLVVAEVTKEFTNCVIVKSIIILLKKGYDKELYHKHVAKFLDSLSSTLILQIANLNQDPHAHTEENQMLWCYLEMFVSKKLHLQNLTAEKVDGLLQVARKRCPELIKLEIKGSQNPRSRYSLIYHKKLELYLQRFQTLQELNVEYFDVEDSCLEVLGVCCKNLRKLNVSNCPKVTDAGIAALCVSVDHLGNKNEAIGQCKSIVNLWTNGTEVTISGIQVALQNLPVLEFWDMVSIQILIQLHKKDFLCKKLVDIPKYSFNYLQLESWKPNTPFYRYISGSLKMVLPFCPSLLEVHINTMSGFKDDDLLCLIYVKKLSKLRIIGNLVDSSVNRITFDDGIVPLLKAKGLTLDLLQIANLNTPININIVTALCPNLSSLALEDNQEYISSTWYSSQPKWIDMPKLEKLVKLFLNDASASRNSGIPSKNLALLLSSPCLIEIDISYCKTLTDDVLLTIAKLNPFLRLQKLSLLACCSITNKGVDVFMQENEIKKISLCFCRGITKDDIHKWESKAVEQKWDLELKYEFVH